MIEFPLITITTTLNRRIRRTIEGIVGTSRMIDRALHATDGFIKEPKYLIQYGQLRMSFIFTIWPMRRESAMCVLTIIRIGINGENLKGQLCSPERSMATLLSDRVRSSDSIF